MKPYDPLYEGENRVRTGNTLADAGSWPQPAAGLAAGVIIRKQWRDELWKDRGIGKANSKGKMLEVRRKLRGAKERERDRGCTIRREGKKYEQKSKRKEKQQKKQQRP